MCFIITTIKIINLKKNITMRKLFSTLLVVAFVFLSVGVQAQFKIGAKAGVTMSQYKTDNLLKDDMGIKPGYSFGTMVDIKIIPFVHLQPEFTYYQKGAMFKGDVLGIDYLTKSTTNYLHVPVNLKINLPVVPVYLIAGPYLSYGLSSSYYHEVAGVTMFDNTAVDFGFDKNSGDIRPFDFGVNFGTGYHKDILAGLVTIFVEARFDVSLLDTDNYENTYAKNRNVGINAGVLFGL